MVQLRVMVVTIIVFGLIGTAQFFSPALLRARLRDARNVNELSDTSLMTPIALTLPQPSQDETSPTSPGRVERVLDTATPEPRATLPPVFTPTASGRGQAAAQAAQTSGSGQSTSNQSADASGQPSSTPVPTFTQAPTSTRTPTVTPTPMYDFIVTKINEVPKPEYRQIAYVRCQLIDPSGHLVPGAYFQISSDEGSPIWTAAEPHGTAPVNGTAVFVVTRGKFAVRVLGGRSQYAGWMVTGTGTDGPMSDFDVTFQETGLVNASILVSPTPTNTPTATPPAVPTHSGTPVAPTATASSAVSTPTSVPIATATPVASTPTSLPTSAPTQTTVPNSTPTQSHKGHP